MFFHAMSIVAMHNPVRTGQMVSVQQMQETMIQKRDGVSVGAKYRRITESWKPGWKGLRKAIIHPETASPLSKPSHTILI